MFYEVMAREMGRKANFPGFQETVIGWRTIPLSDNEQTLPFFACQIFEIFLFKGIDHISLYFEPYEMSWTVL